MQKILFYCRYVDDILIIINAATAEVPSLSNEFCSLHPKMIFTHQIMSADCSINYLDLTLTLSNNHITFAIYRKPTTSDAVIHSTSCHPYSHKVSFFSSMIDRVCDLPLNSETVEQELANLRHIAGTNGYQASLVDRLYSRKISKNNTSLLPSTITTESIYVSLPFIGNLSYRLAALLKTTHIKVAFTINDKIQYRFHHSERLVKDSFSQSGVYKIQCLQCPLSYIGQTGRAFKTRFQEHLLTKKGAAKNNSAFSEHLKRSKHIQPPPRPRQIESSSHRPQR